MYPTAQQRQTLQQWLGTARFVYNRTLDFLKSLEGERPPGCK
ncbi:MULTISPECIES: helix-turn-helix domain-containing protein [unclassified Synechococcus]